MMMSNPATKEKNPLLDLILQKYIKTSRDSIHGPVALKKDRQLMSTNKTHEKKKLEIPDESKLQPASLDGHSVSSFEVGGEKRICFTEIVQAVLKDVNVQEIFKKRDNLLIFTSKCSQKQLDELKYHGVLPWTTTSSNLITKSDAFRLIGALQGNLAIKSENKRGPLSFEVYHECFGGCIGLLEPDLYTSINAPCIRCTECNGLFSTRHFVSHNHSSYDEVHTCHWGFDSTNWRIYTMLVEENPTRELCAMWDRIRKKFDQKSESKVPDADFVAYVNSPDNQKALVSPIENLRNREAASSASAFRPWSPNNGSASYSSSYTKSYNRFTFPNSGPSHHSELPHNRDNCPNSPVYLNCRQCKTVAQATCPSGLHIGAHHDYSDLKREPGLTSNHSCGCSSCKHGQYSTKSDSLEGSIEEVIRNFTNKDNKLTTSSNDLAKLLSNELKRLSIVNDEKVREISISNQRLQTELHLVKMESATKLAEARDTKANVEQELEVLHRERQKEISMFNQLQWELQKDIAQRKESGSGSEVETLQKEVTLLRAHLQQTKIDRENLQKQLEWHMRHKKSNIDSNWRPFPTMAKHFSDDENDEPSKSQKISVLASRSDSINSPVTKSRRIEERSDESSDIEVDD